jgi:hypothetical protein
MGRSSSTASRTSTPRSAERTTGGSLVYDNSHDHHHRHFMGKQESFEFAGYEALAKWFYHEVRDLWRSEDEERRKSH